MKLVIYFIPFFLTHLVSMELLAKRTVCTVTINSSDEKQVFEKNLDPKKFHFVELTTLKESPETGESWLEEACRAQIQCDALIISGHFADSFFGENSTEAFLSMSTLEKKSCEKNCDGILKRPKEVFLFGCNTLAKKEQDHRTPEQYRQVLIQDGIDSQTAERIAQVRYGVLGSSYHDQMRRVFQGVPLIHGFDSVGPAGNTIRPFLRKFFQTSESYDKRLERIEAQSMVDLIEKSNNVLSQINGNFKKVLSNTAYVYCSGFQDQDHQIRIKEKICEFQDSSRSAQQKEKLIQEMLESPDRLSYIPTLKKYLSEHELSQDFKNRLRLNPEIQNQLEKDNQLLLNSPLVYVDFFNFRERLGLVTEKEKQRTIQILIKNLLKNITTDSVNILCDLPYHTGQKLEVEWDDIPLNQRQSQNIPKLMRCLDKPSFAMKQASLDILRSWPKEEREVFLLHYSNRFLESPELLSAYYGEIKKISKKQDSRLERERRSLLYKLNPSETEVIRDFETRIHNSEEMFVILDVLNFRQVKSPSLAQSSLNILKDLIAKKEPDPFIVEDYFESYFITAKPSLEDLKPLFQDHKKNYYPGFLDRITSHVRKNSVQRDIISELLNYKHLEVDADSLIALYSEKPLTMREKDLLMSAVKRKINVVPLKTILLDQNQSLLTPSERHFLQQQ
jgi:hypothetical protein